MVEVPERSSNVMLFGVGAFTQGFMKILRENGASPSAYLTRPYGHSAPRSEGPTFAERDFPDPAVLLRKNAIDLVIPMSIEWSQRPWKDSLLGSGVPLLCPTGDALLLERDRDFARGLCQRYGIPFPKSRLAHSRTEAEAILRADPRGYVIKNPLCSPTSPIHTIVCETVEETRSWLPELDYSEGVFLQEYVGRKEAGHIALVSNGAIHSLVTNQEYKRAFDGNMGVVAGAPLGGLAEQDPSDKYGLAAELLHPLLPWFREVNYHGPVQVTAALHQDRWHVLEYNVRLGVTNGTLLLKMLRNPAEALWRTAKNLTVNLQFHDHLAFGCSITLAGYGYPYVSLRAPRLPITVTEPLKNEVWWNEMEVDESGNSFATGHRIADVNAWGKTVEEAVRLAYSDVRQIRCLGSYYRTDIGQSLWPPGKE